MNKKFIVIISVLAVLISGFAGFILGKEFFNTEEKIKNNVVNSKEENNNIENNDDSISNTSTNNSDEIKYVNNVYTEDNFTYYLDISKLKLEKEIEYKLDNNFNIKLAYIESEDERPISYKMYVNGQFTREDAIYIGDNIKMNVINDTLIDTNHFATDIRSKRFYIISKEGKITKELYQLEEIKGMVADKYQFENGKLIIEGTRINHGPNIVYGDNGIMGTYVCDEDEINKLDANIYIKATYTYEFNEGNISLVKTTGTQTLSEYLTSEKESACKYYKKN